MLFEGVFRRFQALRSGKGPIDARLTGAESLAVAQVEPPGMEMSRAGRRFNLGYSAAPTGIAPVQALPTTAAQWLIWNADPTRAYWMETLGVYDTSGTPGVGGVLLAALVSLPANTGGSSAGISVASASNGGLASKAIVKSAVTITQPAAPTWVPIADNPSPNVGAFPGSATMVNRNLFGQLVIPPNQGLALAVLALAGTTPLFAPFGTWCELESDLE